IGVYGDVALCPYFRYGLKLKMKLKIGTQGYVPIFRLCGETLPRMSFILRCLPLGVFLPIVAFGQGAPHTMRIDYYHSGNVSQELFSLDRVIVEPLAWPGN